MSQRNNLGCLTHGLQYHLMMIFWSPNRHPEITRKLHMPYCWVTHTSRHRWCSEDNLRHGSCYGDPRGKLTTGHNQMIISFFSGRLWLCSR